MNVQNFESVLFRQRYFAAGGVLDVIRYINRASSDSAAFHNLRKCRYFNVIEIVPPQCAICAVILEQNLGRTTAVTRGPYAVIKIDLCCVIGILCWKIISNDELRRHNGQAGLIRLICSRVAEVSYNSRRGRQTIRENLKRTEAHFDKPSTMRRAWGCCVMSH